MLKSTPKTWQIFLMILWRWTNFLEFWNIEFLEFWNIEVTSVYKKDDMNDKQNSRPVSSLSNLSKVFEKQIYCQINTYMSHKFSKYLTGFHKNHNTHHALINVIENWKSNLNKANEIGAIFMGLSKAFHTLYHFLLISKLEAYGFDSLSLELMKYYLTNRKQRCKVGNYFSIRRKITSGVLVCFYFNIWTLVF